MLRTCAERVRIVRKTTRSDSLAQVIKARLSGEAKPSDDEDDETRDDEDDGAGETRGEVGATSQRAKVRRPSLRASNSFESVDQSRGADEFDAQVLQSVDVGRSQIVRVDADIDGAKGQIICRGGRVSPSEDGRTRSGRQKERLNHASLANGHSVDRHRELDPRQTSRSR